LRRLWSSPRNVPIIVAVIILGTIIGIRIIVGVSVIVGIPVSISVIRVVAVIWPTPTETQPDAESAVEPAAIVATVATPESTIPTTIAAAESSPDSTSAAAAESSATTTYSVAASTASVASTATLSIRKCRDQSKKKNEFQESHTTPPFKANTETTKACANCSLPPI
jgi:hypothetical protein